MLNNTQHWPILQRLELPFLDNVRSFMVVGEEGEGALLVTEPDGELFRCGELSFIDIRARKRKTRSESFNEQFQNSPCIQPILVPNVKQIVRMAHGTNHAVLLTKDGQLFGFRMSDFGTPRDVCHLPQLITITSKSSSSKSSDSTSEDLQPQEPKEKQCRFVAISCGSGHSLALTDEGRVWAWGANAHGQVGVWNATYYHPNLNQITELNGHRVRAVECGGGHSLALTDKGEVFAWGWNECGQLGAEIVDKRLSCKHNPCRMDSTGPIKMMAAGSRHTLLLTETGQVYACGDNDSGQLGVPTTEIRTSSSLILVPGLPAIAEIAATKNYSIARSVDREVFVWGSISMTTHRLFKLPQIYSTIDSAFSFDSSNQDMPFSVEVHGPRPNRLVHRMFDCPNHSDVHFIVDKQTLHAHRCILKTSSEYFARMFSQTWNPVNPEKPIVEVRITDYSYLAFEAYLRFLYTGQFSIATTHLMELFELASCYLESNLQRHCLRRMRATVTVANCCHYYQLTERHSLSDFQLELIRFIWSKLLEVFDSEAYQAMDSDLCKKLTLAFRKIE